VQKTRISEARENAACFIIAHPCRKGWIPRRDAIRDLGLGVFEVATKSCRSAEADLGFLASAYPGTHVPSFHIPSLRDWDVPLVLKRGLFLSSDAALKRRSSTLLPESVALLSVEVEVPKDSSAWNPTFAKRARKDGARGSRGVPTNSRFLRYAVAVAPGYGRNDNIMGKTIKNPPVGNGRVTRLDGVRRGRRCRPGSLWGLSADRTPRSHPR
jgi:hypothetical protein